MKWLVHWLAQAEPANAELLAESNCQFGREKGVKGLSVLEWARAWGGEEGLDRGGEGWECDGEMGRERSGEGSIRGDGRWGWTVAMAGLGLVWQKLALNGFK